MWLIVMADAASGPGVDLVIRRPRSAVRIRSGKVFGIGRRSSMRPTPTATLTLLLLVLITAAGAAPAHSRAAAASHAAPTRLLGLQAFEASVSHGPDTGLSLSGKLTLRDDRAGALTGRLAPAQGPPVPVSGQLTGRAISLIVYVGHGKHLVGVGTFGHDPGAKQWFAGGPLVGPNKAAAGDWIAETTTASSDTVPVDAGR
jgi:hypothetical protein